MSLRVAKLMRQSAEGGQEDARMSTPRRGDPRSSEPLSPMHVDENDDYKANDNVKSSPSSPPFHRDQRVWAQDPVTDRYYLATIRDMRWVANLWEFLVHYQGWNSRWDRWVDANKIAKESATESLRAAGLLSPATKAAVQSTEEDAENEETIVNVTANRKRKNDAEMSKTVAMSSRKRRTAKNRKVLPYTYHCELPLTLQTVLVEEWERVTSPSQKIGKPPTRLVHSLPASVTIHQVLKHFAKKQKQAVYEEASNISNDALESSSRKMTVLNIDDFCNGMSQLFQAALPKCLLYDQERPQYELLLNDHELSQKRYTEVFGCEYLLRLYVRLPVLLPDTDETTKKSLLGPLLSDLLLLMQKNRQACFKSDYRRPQQKEWLENELRLYRASDTAAMTTYGMDEETVEAS